MQDIILFMQQHWTLSLGLIVVLVLLILLEFIKQQHGAKNLTPAQATQLINRENAQVIDVRDADAYLKSHIIGAISLPLKDVEEKYKKIEKFKNQPIIIACGTGAESQRAATLLTQKGFNVQILGGGLRAWREADLPVVKG